MFPTLVRPRHRGACKPARHAGVQPDPCCPAAGDRPTPRCPPESCRRLAPSDGFQARLRAAQRRQTASAFPLDQGAQRLAHQGRLFFQAGVALGCGEQVVVEGKGYTHDGEVRAEHKLRHQLLRVLIPKPMANAIYWNLTSIPRFHKRHPRLRMFLID